MVWLWVRGGLGGEEGSAEERDGCRLVGGDAPRLPRVQIK